VADLLIEWFKKRDETRRGAAASDFERMLRGAALRVTRPCLAVPIAVHDDPHTDTKSIRTAGREEQERQEEGPT
jgi:Fur family ferric uptake transcriptional regulator